MSSLFPSGAIRSIRAILTPSKEETIGFVRFHDEGPEDLAVANGNLTGKGAEFQGDGCWEMPGDPGDGEPGKRENGIMSMSMEPVKDFTPDEKKQERNRITAWQAGWNVTNAIQVKHFPQ